MPDGTCIIVQALSASSPHIGENVLPSHSQSAVAFILVFFTFPLFLTDSHAGDGSPWVHELRLGVLNHDTDNMWSGFSRESGIDVNAELILSPSYELWHGQVRPNLGFSVNTEGDTSKVYAGGVWEYLWKSGFLLDFGAGLAVHDGETDDPASLVRKQLGTRVLLRFSLELGYALSEHSRIYLMTDHVSNGYTVDPNEGMDTLGIRYGYLF
jgi:lipid A 3-O-deacylase